MTRFIARVDDVGQAVDQTQRDVGLEYFWSWWKAGGWGEYPIYLGVVPAAVGPVEIEMLLELERTTKAKVCLHGWDHHPHALRLDDLSLAQVPFQDARVVIPPYNQYDSLTFQAMKELGLNVLLGGFDGEHHELGPRPKLVNGILHLSAERELYAHSYRLIETVGKIDDPGYPRQLVLHLRWDEGRLDTVGNLRAALADRMVAVDEAWPESPTPPREKGVVG